MHVVCTYYYRCSDSLSRITWKERLWQFQIYWYVKCSWGGTLYIMQLGLLWKRTVVPPCKLLMMLQISNFKWNLMKPLNASIDQGKQLGQQQSTLCLQTLRWREELGEDLESTANRVRCQHWPSLTCVWHTEMLFCWMFCRLVGTIYI